MIDGRDGFVPVVVGQELELVCESIGKKGDGIFRYEGFVIIVPGVEVSRVYQISIIKVLKSMAFGEVKR